MADFDETGARHRFWAAFVAGAVVSVLAVVALVVVVATGGSSTSPASTDVGRSASSLASSPVSDASSESTNIDIAGLTVCPERDVTIGIGPEDFGGPMAAAPVTVTNVSESACRLPSLVGVTLFDEQGRLGPRVDASDAEGGVALSPGEQRSWLLLYAHRGGADGTVEGSNYPRAEVTVLASRTLGTVQVLCGGLHVSPDVPLEVRLIEDDAPSTTAPDLTNC